MLDFNAEQVRLYAQLRLKKTELLGQQVEKKNVAIGKFFSHKNICVSADKTDARTDDLINRYEKLIKQIEGAVDKESLAKYFELASSLVSNSNVKETSDHRLSL